MKKYRFVNIITALTCSIIFQPECVFAGNNLMDSTTTAICPDFNALLFEQTKLQFAMSTAFNQNDVQDGCQAGSELLDALNEMLQQSEACHDHVTNLHLKTMIRSSTNLLLNYKCTLQDDSN